MNDSAGKTLDRVLIAVLANRLDSIVREMTNTLFRTGRSAILNTSIAVIGGRTADSRAGRWPPDRVDV